MSVLVDEDCEHFLRVLFLTVRCLGLSINHDLLSCHSLWSLLHHLLLLLHVAHGVVELLHVWVVPDKHLLSHTLHLLSLVWEALTRSGSIEELVLDARLTTIWRLQQIRVDKNWSSVHQHSLLTVLPGRVELGPRILIKASSRLSNVLHLAWVQHRRSHQGLLLRIHIWRHFHLLAITGVGHLRHSHL